MRVFRGLPVAPTDSIALTIGNFDGVHCGHKAMLARLIEAADDLDLTAAVLTFDPPPREFFVRRGGSRSDRPNEQRSDQRDGQRSSQQHCQPSGKSSSQISGQPTGQLTGKLSGQVSAPPRLSTLRDKLEQFAAVGVVKTFVARFDAALAALEPQAFVEHVLVERLGVRWVLVGDDFRFGRARAGNLSILREHAKSFSVEGMATIEVDGERASSTAVRAALAAGELARAQRLLGRPNAISGKVGHGDKRGRDLGFTTANIPLSKTPALSGIFAVCVHGLGTDAKRGVASLGVRPTLTHDNQPVLEVYLFDFDQSIYGRRITVEFMHKLRDEERYPDLATLTAQIGRDVANARAYFDVKPSPMTGRN